MHLFLTRIGRFHRLPPLSLSYNATRVGIRKIMTLADEIAEQTTLFNNLRLQNADPAEVEAAKRKLGELKKAQGVLNAKEREKKGDSAEGEKKKERILLKTPKVSHFHSRIALCT